MGGLRISNEVILAKIETTYNTDATPAATTNAILVRNVDMRPEGLRMVDREAIRGGLGRLQQIYGGQLKRITFECEVKGSGSAGTAPEIGALLQACGMDETVVASTSVTYTATNSSHKSVTIYYYEGGRKLHKITGARGTVTLRAEAGGILLAAFEFVGHYGGVSDASQPTPTYNSRVPHALVGLSVALNGVTAIVARSWEWALNNTIALPPSMSASDGYSELIITERNVTGEMLIESELSSTIDVDTLLSGGTRFAFASGTIGSSAGNRVAVSTPASSTYVTDQALDAADGLRLRRVPLAVDDSVANSFSIVFT